MQQRIQSEDEIMLVIVSTHLPLLELSIDHTHRGYNQCDMVPGLTVSVNSVGSSLT